MNIHNREREAIKTTCSPRELSEAFQGMDLSAVPPEHRMAAIRHRMAEVMLATTTSPAERAKPAFTEALKTWTEVTRQRRAAAPIITPPKGSFIT